MPFTVMIPVGPYAFYKKYLSECVDSVRQQTIKPAEILLIDDMADVTPDDYPDCRVWRAPWLLGVPAAANCGVSLAKNEHVFMLACDDKLMPNAVERIWQTRNKYPDPLGYYWVNIEYSTGEKQALPCGHALVSKSLWRHTGGFPPESGVGACDHIFVSMLLAQHGKAGKLYHVEGEPIYWHREHEEQYTRHQVVNQSTIADVRDCFSRRWQPVNDWERYES